MGRNQSDTAWKTILDTHLKDFFDYCLPKVSLLINWKKTPIPLDKEMEAITKGNNAGKRLLDKLFKEYFKDGREQWLLVHIEVQGKPDHDFPQRMFTYAYRAFDKYQKPILSCAILTDDSPTWRPDRYEIETGGCCLGLKFLVIKLLDYRAKKADLEASNNVFASVILAQLKALEIKEKPDNERKRVKFALTRRLYEKGFNKQQVANVYLFIDWLIGLPDPLEVEYINELYSLEEEMKMTYVSFAERRGKKEGKAEGKLEVARLLIKEKVSPSFIKRTTGLSLEKIKGLVQEKKASH